MLGLIGQKLGETQIYNSAGVIVPVTMVQAGPNRVIQCKTPERDGYSSVQLGFGEQKEQRLNRPIRGHLQKHQAKPVRIIREFRDFPRSVQPGEEITVNLFQEGDYVDVIGLTKGRGFQGVVKRYGFHGGPETHGTKGWRRRTGAIGQRLTPGHVRKGTKMPGHMGQRRCTIQNLEVVRLVEEDHLILIKGSVPGAKGDFVIVREAKKMPKAEAQSK